MNDNEREQIIAKLAELKMQLELEKKIQSALGDSYPQDRANLIEEMETSINKAEELLCKLIGGLA